MSEGTANLIGAENRQGALHLTVPEPLRQLYPRRALIAIAGVYGALVVIVPLLNLVVPRDSVFHVSDYSVALAGKILCYAMVALAMDLIWGYTGILSLGHGLFFALGGYAMGMYLMRAIGTEGVYQSTLPDFMVFLDWKQLPWYWHGSDRFWWACTLVVLAPGLLALVFGFFAFRSRIRGVYFSIITQALTYAFMLLFFRNATGFGGNNGFTDFKRILSMRVADPRTKVTLYVLSATALLLALVLCRFIVRSKLGRVLTAIRDEESRVRFCGYDPVRYKLFVWTLSAVICGIAGALYVPQVGIINPSEMSPANSIEIAIWVAVGGRGTLIGPIIGAALVNGAKSWLTAAVPDLWLYALGLMFIFVTRFLPAGIFGALFRAQKP
jgi:urea transport system permease protein